MLIALITASVCLLKKPNLSCLSQYCAGFSCNSIIFFDSQNHYIIKQTACFVETRISNKVLPKNSKTPGSCAGT